jgi:hypothetical protein
MIKLILMATAVLAIASLVVGTISIQQAQAKYITNTHAHSDVDNPLEKSNDGSVTNCSGESCAASWGSEKYHINTNDNVNRPVGEDGVRSNTNSHEMPNKGGNSDKP